MRTFIVCLPQGRTDTFEICFNLFTPPYRDVPFECVTPWMRCDTDVPFICHIQNIKLIYVYTQMHLNIWQYHTIYPPPFFLLRDSNHESCQREKHLYLHILHPYSYSITTTASLKRAFILLDNPHIIGCWNSGAARKYPPPILLIFLFLSIIYYLYLQM